MLQEHWHILEDWYMLLRVFSEHKLKYGRDRLPALAGLARLYQARLRDDYCAGLWKGDLARGLSWSRRPNYSTNNTWPIEDQKSKLGAHQSQLPSWSWASCNYPIFSGTPFMDVEPSLLDIRSDSHSLCQTDDVSKVLLLVRGRIKKAFVTNDVAEDKATMRLSGDLTDTRRVDLDDPFFGAPSSLSKVSDSDEAAKKIFTKEIECLLLSSREPPVPTWSILLLERVNDHPTPNVYRRIGAADLDLDWDWFAGIADRTIRIV